MLRDNGLEESRGVGAPIDDEVSNYQEENVKLSEKTGTVLPLLRAFSPWLEALSVFQNVADRRYLAWCTESSDKRIH